MQRCPQGLEKERRQAHDCHGLWREPPGVWAGSTGEALRTVLIEYGVLSRMGTRGLARDPEADAEPCGRGVSRRVTKSN